MRIHSPESLATLVAIVTLSGCSSVPKSFKETTLDDMYPILTGEQYRRLDSAITDGEISDFLEAFWQENDPISSTPENEFKAEYARRLEYANAHFPDRRGWGRSDRKKIYLVHGPPGFVERYQNVNTLAGAFSQIKSLEVWLYLTPGRNHALPSFGDDIYPGEMKFIFADMTGSGVYTILYSSEDRADIDIRTLKLP